MKRTDRFIDDRPGPLPEIRADGQTVWFSFQIQSAHEKTRLVIRCDADGNVSASIDPTPTQSGDAA
jgi:hypothetical protein